MNPLGQICRYDRRAALVTQGISSKGRREQRELGSARNEVALRIVWKVCRILVDSDSVAMEPDRLMQISLGQANPRMWTSAAPG